MSTLSYAVRDSATMLRRDFRHSLRYPMMTVTTVALPVFYLLLFVGVFGNTLRAGLGAATPSGGHYVDYLAPGVLVMTACASAEMTAVSVNTDMTEGIIARFRTMAIARTSVLTGQVFGGLTRALASGVLVVAVALGLGFRPTATPVEWVAAAGVFAATTDTVSPRRTPRADNAEASRWHRSRVCAQVNRRPPCTTASRSG